MSQLAVDIYMRRFVMGWKKLRLEPLSPLLRDHPNASLEFKLKCPSPMGPAPILKFGIGRPFL
jgi:hypothetical protein